MVFDKLSTVKVIELKFERSSISIGILTYQIVASEIRESHHEISVPRINIESNISAQGLARGLFSFEMFVLDIEVPTKQI